MILNKISDLLIVSKAGDSMTEGNLIIEFENVGAGTLVRLRSKSKGELIYREVKNSRITILSELLPDDIYYIDFVSSKDAESETYASGLFKIEKRVAAQALRTYDIELLKVWNAISYLVKKIETTSEAVSNMINGFVSE